MVSPMFEVNKPGDPKVSKWIINLVILGGAMNGLYTYPI